MLFRSAETVKGHGVGFAAGRSEWHSRVATADEVEAARLELGEATAEVRA